MPYPALFVNQLPAVLADADRVPFRLPVRDARRLIAAWTDEHHVAGVDAGRFVDDPLLAGRRVARARALMPRDDVHVFHDHALSLGDGLQDAAALAGIGAAQNEHHVAF